MSSAWQQKETSTVILQLFTTREKAELRLRVISHLTYKYSGISETFRAETLDLTSANGSW